MFSAFPIGSVKIFPNNLDILLTMVLGVPFSMF